MESSTEAPVRPARVPGLLALLGIVALGLVSGAVYFHYEQPRLAAKMQERIDALPSTPEGRLEQWLLFGGPQIHHRLSKFGRLSDATPWLVTHAIDHGPEGADVAGGALEIWGIDCLALPRELARQEGLTVVIELPAPRSLGRAPLQGSMSEFIPVYRDPDDVPDPVERLRYLADYLLEDMPAALSQDIEGARIEFRIASQ